ncbi:BREX-2 system adenine-specific DNA-methyltransferase PglX [Sorangium sp. So ce1128]
MKPNDRARLTAALREHVAKIAADLRVKMRAPGAVRARAMQLHADEQVAEDFEVWTDLLSRRAAVLWVLKSVYVRVLEDRGLLNPGRLLDPEAQQLFERLAPHLGETAFLRWVWRDLASKSGGLPELFSPQPAEVALPSDELSRRLIEFWRHRDADTGSHWSFAEERFEGELMGDLYQELDPAVKERFALCQTPDFVRGFILDRTLTPAIETFGADKVRLLDPACGSGHFLIDGLKRIVAATGAQHPDWRREKVALHALDRVVGVDLNDYACGLARARLVMTAAELAGVSTLAAAAQFHPHVYWADGLEQVEREEAKAAVQFGLFETVEERPRATLTRSDVRAALRKVFASKFHAVVANPPYITEKDAGRKDYHRAKVDKTQRYVSAYREYSLGSPFTERCFQLAEKEGFVGIITSNNFMKREFGKPLIEKVLAGLDLTLVVDTSQAYIPFHGTPTVLLFGRNRRPATKRVRAVMGKRGESGTPEDPATGRVWLSIAEGWDRVGFENEYMSVADLPRETLSTHPWSLGGGGASELKERIETSAVSRLINVVDEIGAVSVIRADDVYEPPIGSNRGGLPEHLLMSHVVGQDVRNWSIAPSTAALHPYGPSGDAFAELEGAGLRRLWPFRTLLKDRVAFGKRQTERGLKWFEYSMLFKNRFLSQFLIVFPNVATHNHFCFLQNRMVVNSKAPVIKLPAGSTEDDYLALLGLLNSSTACFWMKQVFHNKGLRGQGGGITATDWEQFYEFDATKAKLFPLAKDAARAAPYAAQLDELARARASRGVGELLANLESWTNAAELRTALDVRRQRDLSQFQRMVALQEELDWICYAIYDLDNVNDVLPPEAIEPLLPTWLPWCMDFAQRDAANRSAIARGEKATDQPTVWFERHRWEPVTDLPAECSHALRTRIEARRARTRTNPALQLIETPNFKRRWYNPDYPTEEKQALELWLADCVESAAKDRGRPFPLEQIVASLQDDPRVLAVCEVLTGRRDFSLTQLVADALQSDAVPNHRFHVYKPAGLVKREAWERTWEDQHREDAGEKVTPEVPPPYVNGDFLKPDYWQLRGKLDVPKERFIAFTEVPGRPPSETLYGWAGWTPLERLKAILAIDEDLEDAGIPLADRIGLLDSAWRLLPDVAREDAPAATRLKAELQALVGPDGPSRELLEEWRKRFPPPTTRVTKAKRAAAARAEPDGEEADEP